MTRRKSANSKEETVSTELRVNEKIQASPVRLVAADGSMKGVVERLEAIRFAKESNLDLVEVSPQTKPPVCKVMDYGKYKFEQKNKHKQKKTHTGELKEIRLRFKIEDNDFRIKSDQARRFLAAGHRLQLTLTLHGRELMRKDLATEVINKFRDSLSDVSKVERDAFSEGKKITMLMAPKKR